MPAPKPIREHGFYEPYRVWIGSTDWQLYRIDKEDPAFIIGGAYDPVTFGKHFQAGIYADTAGLVNEHPSYKYYGGGLELRGYVAPMSYRGLNLYGSAGYGAYHADITEAHRDSMTALAPRFAVGLEFWRRFFVEANYTAFGVHFDRDMGRFGFDVGIHF